MTQINIGQNQLTYACTIHPHPIPIMGRGKIPQIPMEGMGAWETHFNSRWETHPATKATWNNWDWNQIPILGVGELGSRTLQLLPFYVVNPDLLSKGLTHEPTVAQLDQEHRFEPADIDRVLATVVIGSARSSFMRVPTNTATTGVEVLANIESWKTAIQINYEVTKTMPSQQDIRAAFRD